MLHRNKYINNQQKLALETIFGKDLSTKILLENVEAKIIAKLDNLIKKLSIVESDFKQLDNRLSVMENKNPQFNIPNPLEGLEYEFFVSNGKLPGLPEDLSNKFYGENGK